MENSEKPGIEALPNEVLLRILCYLPFESLKNCYYVKAFNLVLKENVRYLPKLSITKCLISNVSSSPIRLTNQENEKITIHIEKNSYKMPKKVWTIRLLTGESSTELDVTEFYRSKGLTGLKWNAGFKTVDTFVPNTFQALEKHLTFVCRRVFFLILELNNISKELADLIRVVFKKCNSKATNVKMTIEESLQPEHIKLIKETKCETLNIRRRISASVDLLFENATVIKNVWSLKILAGQDLESPLKMNDDFLLSIPAEDIDINGRTQITVEGVRRLITHYLENQRTIDTIRFGLRFPKCPTEIRKKHEYFQEIFYSWNQDPILKQTDREFQWTIESGERERKLLISFDDHEYFSIAKLEYEVDPDSRFR